MFPTHPVRWLLIAVGVFWIYFGIRYVLDGDSTKLGQGLVILFPLGIGFLAVGWLKASDVGSVEGVLAAEVADGPEPRRATVFKPVPARNYSAVLMMNGFMCMGIGMALFPGVEENATDVRIIGAVIALPFAALIFLNLRGVGRGYMTVVLTPDWIMQRNRVRNQVVDWEEIGQVSRQQFRGTTWTVLHQSGPNVMLPHGFMAADPAVLHALVEHMHANPQDRPLLADPGGVEALRRLGLGPAEAGDGPQPEQGDAGGEDHQQRSD